jgi:hypothetical protein
MDTPTTKSTSKKKPALSWSPLIEQVLFEGLLNQIRLGKRADTGIKREAWIYVLPLIQNYITQLVDGVLYQVTQAQASNKFSEFKTIFIEWQALRKNSGFGWDEKTQLITAPDAVWDIYIAVSIYYISLLRRYTYLIRIIRKRSVFVYKRYLIPIFLPSFSQISLYLASSFFLLLNSI